MLSITPSPGTIARNAATIPARRAKVALSASGIMIAICIASGSAALPICHGKSTTSAPLWVGYSKVEQASKADFALGQAREHETRQGFVACPVQADHAKCNPHPPGRNEEQHMKILTLSALAIVTSLA